MVLTHDCKEPIFHVGTTLLSMSNSKLSKACHFWVCTYTRPFMSVLFFHVFWGTDTPETYPLEAIKLPAWDSRGSDLVAVGRSTSGRSVLIVLATTCIVVLDSVIATGARRGIGKVCERYIFRNILCYSKPKKIEKWFITIQVRFSLFGGYCT